MAKLEEMSGKLRKANTKIKLLMLKLFGITSDIRRAVYFLVLVGILALLQKNGAFDNYPAINEFVSTLLTIFEWFYAILIKLVNWVATLPPIQWLATTI